MYMQEEQQAAMVKVMRRMGITEIKATFSGGGDSGSIESAVATMRDGTVRELESHHHTQFDWGGKTYWVKPLLSVAAIRDEWFTDMLWVPLSDEYGSFNNEPYVDGWVALSVEKNEYDDHFTYEANESWAEDDDDWDEEESGDTQADEPVSGEGADRPSDPGDAGGA